MIFAARLIYSHETDELIQNKITSASYILYLGEYVIIPGWYTVVVGRYI